MKAVSIITVQNHINELVNQVKETGEVFAIGKKKKIDALLMKFPDHFNNSLSSVTNINTYSQSFDFLNDEPDLYTIEDIKL